MDKRVLVFDDDPAIGRMVVRVANMTGLDATAVADAASFEQILQQHVPQIVVLDLQLGATDGVEQLRLLATWKYTGVLILMSGHGARVLTTVRALGHSLGLNVECILEKPLRVADLERVFARLMVTPESLSAERLMAAITNDELTLEFQPVVSRKPKILKKLEALVRWEHPSAGLILPDAFLPVAESNQTIIDALTEWLVGAAIDAYLVLAELDVQVPIAINISTGNLHDLTLPDRVEQRLRGGGMPMEHLCLEITESAAFQDATVTMDILSRLRLKGMALSIDDFGTGYSSLKLLRQMPFSEIKIDRSFVSDLTTSRDARAITKSIIDLAANMEMVCVAEGVETEEIAACLEQLGACDMQGYLIARPMPVEAVPAWLNIWLQAGTVSSLGGTNRSTLDSTTRSAQKSPSDLEDARSPTKRQSDAVRLSPRQIEVMRQLSNGRSVKEIARHLNLGVGTVKVHLSLAYSTLGAHNRTEAIRRAAPLLVDRTGNIGSNPLSGGC
jgi:EAL domain-containing protein (putative c-di-GMP-specific phosphodiesterase class I)/DNA-binding CsgD family transcriptional regulator